MIPLARKTLIHEWRRFLPAIMAIGFSGVLLCVQAALVLGIFGSAAVYVTSSSAHLWAGYPGTQSVNFGRAVGPDVEMRLRIDPDVSDVEPYLWIEGDWHNSDNTSGGVSVFVSGIDTRANGMVFSRLLSKGLRKRLDEPNAVIVDRAELDQLGIDLDQTGWINGQRVRVIAAIAGLRGLGGVNVLASLDTARRMQGAVEDEGATYYVARLIKSASIDAAQQRLKSDPAFGPFEVWGADQFALKSQMYWMFDTGAGVAVLFMASIVCLVGAVVTSQSLMAMVTASAREYAVLNALGASRRALSRVVLEQSCWIGGLGLIVAAVACTVLLSLAASRDVPVAMNLSVALVCAALVFGLALISGLIAMRGLLRADPALLLR
jgi:putative ABC transport system permease protein